jgi:hypothetical protein
MSSTSWNSRTPEVVRSAPNTLDCVSVRNSGVRSADGHKNREPTHTYDLCEPADMIVVPVSREHDDNRLSGIDSKVT